MQRMHFYSYFLVFEKKLFLLFCFEQEIEFLRMFIEIYVDTLETEI